MRLAAHEEFKILEAGSGDEALAICQSYSGTIDVVVADVIMAGMWGHELASRQALLRPRIPVLLISGHSQDMLVDHGILTGKEHFLEKPFKGRVLEQKIKDLLEPQRSAILPNESALPAGNEHAPN
jgi:DNA-binding NtrC family response regulator